MAEALNRRWDFAVVKINPFAKTREKVDSMLAETHKRTSYPARKVIGKAEYQPQCNKDVCVCLMAFLFYHLHRFTPASAHLLSCIYTLPSAAFASQFHHSVAFLFWSLSVLHDVHQGLYIHRHGSKLSSSIKQNCHLSPTGP